MLFECFCGMRIKSLCTKAPFRFLKPAVSCFAGLSFPADLHMLVMSGCCIFEEPFGVISYLRSHCLEKLRVFATKNEKFTRTFSEYSNVLFFYAFKIVFCHKIVSDLWIRLLFSMTGELMKLHGTHWNLADEFNHIDTRIIDSTVYHLSMLH